MVAFDQIIIRRMQVLDDSNVSLDNETIAMETIYSYCIKQTYIIFSFIHRKWQRKRIVLCNEKRTPSIFLNAIYLNMKEYLNKPYR